MKQPSFKIILIVLCMTTHSLCQAEPRNPQIPKTIPSPLPPHSIADPGTAKNIQANAKEYKNRYSCTSVR